MCGNSGFGLKTTGFKARALTVLLGPVIGFRISMTSAPAGALYEARALKLPAPNSSLNTPYIQIRSPETLRVSG